MGFFDSFKPLYKHNVYEKKEEDKSLPDKAEKTKAVDDGSKDKDESGSEQGYEMVNPEDVEEDDDGEEQGEEQGEEEGEEGEEEGEEEESAEPKKTR